MSNALKALVTIVQTAQTKIGTMTSGNNRANNMGDGLEEYIKNVFANTFNELSEQKRLETFAHVYSYNGNKNNPPDLMLKNGDAIEIKKLESHATAIALNSSYPKLQEL